MHSASVSKHEDIYKPEQLLGEEAHLQQVQRFQGGYKAKTGSQILKGIIE